MTKPSPLTNYIFLEVEVTVKEGMFLKYFFFGILPPAKVKYLHAERPLHRGI
jgi:hypothetical protein